MEEFIPKVGILLPNGHLEANNGEGHPRHALKICQQLNLEIPDLMNPDDFLIMAGCAMIATYDAFKKRQIKIAKNNSNEKMQQIIKLYLLHDFQVIEGWDLNPQYQEALENALNKVIIEETIIIRRSCSEK